MRPRFTLASILLSALCSNVCAQVSDGTWTHLLQGGAGARLTEHQASLSPSRKKAILRFINGQFREASGFWDAAPHGDRICPKYKTFSGDDPGSLSCLDVRTLPIGQPSVYYVSVQRSSRNPLWWRLEVHDARVYDLAGRQEGTPEILSATHVGLKDVAVALGEGASHVDLNYLTFTGRRYRSAGSHFFNGCGDLPGHAKNDDRWCFEDGHPLPGSSVQ